MPSKSLSYFFQQFFIRNDQTNLVFNLSFLSMLSSAMVAPGLTKPVNQPIFMKTEKAKLITWEGACSSRHYISASRML
jgi:hypothetical protein